MTDFFAYESPYRTGNFITLSTAEYILPFIVLFGLLGLLIYKREWIRNNQTFQKRFELIIGIVFLVLYVSHYALRFNLYGFDKILLPFQLCGISMMFAIYMIFFKTRSIHTFVLFTGVLGGITSLLTPVMGYDSMYYRYYQFYGAHTLLILTPIYFMLIKGYFPTKKDTINAFLILQALAIFMAIFNYYFNTDYMFVFIDPDKIEKFPVIAKFGGIPWYLIWVELTGIAAFAVLYQVTTLIKRHSFVQDENKDIL